MMTRVPAHRPPPIFIHDQAWSLLTDLANPLRHLTASRLRAGRTTMTADRADEEPDVWVPVDPWDVVVGSAVFQTGPSNGGVPGDHPERIDLSHLVITSDAGVGKTTATQWLEYAFGCDRGRETGYLAMRMAVSELCAGDGPVARQRGKTISDRFEAFLAERFQDRIGKEVCPYADALQAIRQARRRSRLVLIVDGLDQPGGSMIHLSDLVRSEDWSGSRWVLAGRPYAIQRYRTELFDGRRWAFVKIEEFEPPQQRRYLGKMADGKTPQPTDRYDELSEDARPILGVPRVLSYLRELNDAEFRQIRTAADVYFKAILVLIKRGMENSPDARLLGWERAEPPATPQNQNLREARRLLSAIAYTLTIQPLRQVNPQTNEARLLPNFDRVPSQDCDCTFEHFEEQLQTRYKSRGTLGQDWLALAALNDILEHGLLDTDLGGLQEIQFRNRSLQEFLCVWYLAREAKPEDAARLSDWIYLPERSESEEYYPIWQFLCEMPNDDHHGYVAENWLTAIEPLYRSAYLAPLPEGDVEHGTRAGDVWQARRSSEMIFRSYRTLTELCNRANGKATRIRDQWWGEFERILAGDQGSARQDAARELTKSFIRFPEGTFKMGSPHEKQGLRGESRSYWEAFIRAGRAAPDREAYVEERYLTQYRWVGRVAQMARAKRKRELLEAIEQGIERFEDFFFARDETPKEAEQTVPAFSLSRSPTVNGWFRLFSPRHGLAASWYRDSYAKVSPTAAHPVVYVSWFDAWVFAHWARWGQASCRLPWENEWERAAKFGVDDWAQDYWWDGRFDPIRCNARRELDATNVPSPDHANPATKGLDDEKHVGIMDQLGDVWEWCQDQYRQVYIRTLYDTPGSPGSSRVLRGGSWNYNADYCRSAYRFHFTPGLCDSYDGFRLSRS